MAQVSYASDGYPRFSSEEMQQRRAALTHVAGEAGVEAVVLYGADRSGSAIQWLTGWPVTREAAVVWTPEQQDALFVQFYNHVPLARQLAAEAEVAWGGDSTIERVISTLHDRGAANKRIGVVGPLPYRAHAALAEHAAETVDLSRAYTSLRMRKSDEEVAWLRRGAELTDAALAALEAGLQPGLTECDLADIVERAYVSAGGTTHIHYFSSTPMAAPERAVPGQYASMREIARGDAVVTEISASFWGYPGQALRTYAVASEPTPLYQEMHDVAEAAFDAVLGVLREGATVAEVLAAAAVIEDAGFLLCDDLLHGFGGGYLPPVVGAPDRGGRQPLEFVFATGMAVVVQPNVITADRKAGVQTGELVLVTADGVERLHDLPGGLRRAG